MNKTMPHHPTRIAVLGSTGSIGRSTLEVVAGSEGMICAIALSAHGNTSLLLQQAGDFRPRWIVVTDPRAADARIGQVCRAA